MTPAQQTLLRFIQQYVRDHDGLTPSFAEMAAAIGQRSKSGVARLVDMLERDGFVRRTRGKSRNVELVEMAPLASVRVDVAGEVRIHIAAGLTAAQRAEVRAALAQAEASL